ncbi:5-oxoprolinase subunit PxpA [Laceyella tengchongensis]|jgi:UPF0271 protein|uniref:LamB/YcsF family protein n=1 Tax=Laceyella tengchongensis TaxID=574699 RepID=UPI0012BA2FA3|nr:5-oxoprolinase subunit PxpA [Laceyella tengchongensis]
MEGGCPVKGSIDINVDLGEGFGRYRLGEDEALLPWVTSANIACGYHAGDPQVMGRAVVLAKTHKVAVGAHPGLPDLLGFGRREMHVSASDVYHMTVYQVGALLAFTRAHQVRLHHVKPHGALYNMAERDPALAEALAQAVVDIDPTLVLYALAGGLLAKAGREQGLAVAEEVFADRTYQADGKLTPRTNPQAVITDPAEAVAQVLTMIKEGVVETLDGGKHPINADTVCLHGDHPHAPALAQALRRRLQAEGIIVKPVGEVR